MKDFICLYLMMILSLLACDDSLDTTLEFAKGNRMELEKVLEHFQKDKNSLEYKSAVFLIKNMRYNYTYADKTMKSFDDVYKQVSNEPINIRTQLFNDRINGIDIYNTEIVSDIETLKSDYIITAIEEACNVWRRTAWKDDYDISLFFEYVLPYRVKNEYPSNWHESIRENFPLLNNKTTVSRRGSIYEAENGTLNKCLVKSTNGASEMKAVELSNKEASVHFKVHSGRNTKKRLIVKYASTNRKQSVTFCVNGMDAYTEKLAPTRNMGTFNEVWSNKSINLKKGENVITLHNVVDTLVLDYIQLSAVEDFTREEIKDFSSYTYSFFNKSARRFITNDTDNNKIVLLPVRKSQDNLYWNIDNQGYPLWSITSCKDSSCIEVEFGKETTLYPNTLISKARFERRPFQQWVFFPTGHNYYRIMNKHTGMYLDIKNDMVTGNMYLVQNEYSNSDTQLWRIEKGERKNIASNIYKMNTAVSEALKIFDFTHQFQFFAYSGDLSPKGSTLIKAKTGNCTDETAFTLYLCRYLGIPSALDFTPHWGNRSNGHSWSVIINPDGKATPFYMGNVPGDTVHYFYSYKKPKIFRQRFSINKAMVCDFAKEKSIPKIFCNPLYTDVTDEYYTTTDIQRNIPQEHKGKRIAYICVFDNRDWVPVYYGKIRDSKVTFPSMGRGIVYISAFYENGKIIPFGDPFLLTDKGEVQELTPKMSRKQTLKLLRKYPFMGKEDFFNFRMDGGVFLASAKSDFNNCDTLYTHKGITNGNWYDIRINSNKKYSFLRYMGPKGSFCNINELAFYDEDNKEIKGKIIGTEGEAWGRKENVFDRNILTGFGALTPDGNWVGLQLSAPKRITRIRYIPRNDGNCIEVNDEYVLYHWYNGRWTVLGKKKAYENMLIFNNIPTGGLFVLKDITKGTEERIFTYEKDEQIWW